MIRCTQYLLEIGNPYFEQMIVYKYTFNIVESVRVLENIILVFSNHGARSSKDNALRTCHERIHQRVVFVNSLRAQVHVWNLIKLIF